MRNRFLIALFFEVFFQVSNLLALQTYPLVDQQQTDVRISQQEPNRIAVAGDRIQQIFGAEGIYDVQSDETSGQIFVRLLDRDKAQSSTLTLVTESGVTHDLTLIPEKITFQSILFKPQLSGAIPIDGGFHDPAIENVSSLSQLVQAMALGQQLKGYRLSKLASSDRSYPEPLQIIPQAFYSGETAPLEGRIYLLKNDGEESIPLSEEILALPQDLALSVSCRELKPGDQGILLVVSKRRGS